MDAAQYVELLMLRVCSAKRFTVGTGGGTADPPAMAAVAEQNPLPWMEGKAELIPQGN